MSPSGVRSLTWPAAWPPASTMSTAWPTSKCTRHLLLASISMATSKDGGPPRSSMLFCTPRLRASSSPRVTLWMPPTKSASAGFFITFSSSFPCAVATSITPRWAIVRAAAHSASVPISSITTTSGMWFSTASIITRCCSSGSGTCMRRARPMPTCGMSPSPPISLLVSTMMTRLCKSSDRARLTSLIAVVLPTPGLPKKRMLAPERTMSATMRALPLMARPARQVSPMMRPARLRMQLIRCRVRSMPARLSPPKVPTF
mmetsp:Transcript_8349/g.22291  ORF Transcript_8349/g.22291 Transcript_8349/m.22291 type:complete len:259 (+) Transcript_8349:1625-2401(+)